MIIVAHFSVMQGDTQQSSEGPTVDLSQSKEHLLI